MELPNYLKIASEKLIEGLNLSAMSNSAKELKWLDGITDLMDLS